MLRRKLKFVAASIISTAVFSTAYAKAPYSTDELALVKYYLLNNIVTEEHSFIKNHDGYLTVGMPGAVLASPSMLGNGFSQDYQFHWTRDAAITMDEVATLYELASTEEKTHLKAYLTNYVNFEAKAQKQNSKPGEQTLGQPKFNIDGTIWEGDWGRPQNDGPALRSIALTHIANIYLQENNETYVRDTLLKMIKTDLQYVAKEWHKHNYDLWEEVYDQDHFFNKMVQRKALIEAAALFKRFDDENTAKFYLSVAEEITESLKKHWNASLGYYSETLYQQYYKGGGLNTSIILGLLYGQIQSANDPFVLNDDKVLSSIYFIRNAFAGLYKVNINSSTPTLVGRYPNDVYDGNLFVYGNPWVLTTNALGQFYYSLAKIYSKQGQITINKNNILFFKQINAHLFGSEKTVTAENNPHLFKAMINALMDEGDKILENVKSYGVCNSDQTCLHFAEQIDRTSGEQTSAKELTWGYVTILEAMQARS